MPKKIKKALQQDDWKRWKRKWPYDSLEDPRYISEKKATLIKNGNGWWYDKGYRRSLVEQYS